MCWLKCGLFFQGKDGKRNLPQVRGVGDGYKRQVRGFVVYLLVAPPPPIVCADSLKQIGTAKTKGDTSTAVTDRTTDAESQ